MSLEQTTSSHTIPSTDEQNRKKQGKRGWTLPVFIVLGLALSAFLGWQIFGKHGDATDPTVSGRPLSNPQTHLHVVAFGDKPGTLYLGTHFGLFVSTDNGQTWPQAHGMLNHLMITSVAVNPLNAQSLAVMGLPSASGTQAGAYFSNDGGNSWSYRPPAGLGPSAYPYAVVAGTASDQHFYVFYVFAGWFETQDMGLHWRSITHDALSNIQTSTLLTYPDDPKHLLLGSDQGLFETRDEGEHWQQISDVRGNVFSIVASHTTPRLIYCATDQGIYQMQDTSHITSLPMPAVMTRLAINIDGTTLCGMNGQDLWTSTDSGLTWKRRWHFDQGGPIALLVDPQNVKHLFVGFYLPGEVVSSTDGGTSWQVLTH